MIALQALAKTANVTEFDWSALESIEAEVVQPMLEIFSEWARLPLTLHFKGDAALHRTLAALTPVGNRDIDAHCWRLRLAVLRVLNAQLAFDDAAMDYCVTYEISPPAWVAPQCQLVISTN
jgi:hypothetical protein